MQKDIKEEACKTITSSENESSNWSRKLYHWFQKDEETKEEHRYGKKTPKNAGSQLSITKETMMIEPEKNGLCSRYSVVMDAI